MDFCNCGQWTEEQVERYLMALYGDKIRLKDVPCCIRMECRWAGCVHITAFRIDRGISRARYKEDLEFLRQEIQIAEGFGDKPLEQVLTVIFDDMNEIFEDEFFWRNKK